MGVTVAVTRERNHLPPGTVIWLWDVSFVSKLIPFNTMRARNVKMVLWHQITVRCFLELYYDFFIFIFE